MLFGPPPDSGRHIITRPASRWLLLVASWTLFGFFMAGQWYIQSSRAGNPVAWSLVLRTELLYALVWLALTPLILWLAWRYPFRAGQWVSVGLLHLAGSVAFAFLHRFLLNTLVQVVEMTPNHAFSWNEILASLFRYFDYGIMIYWILLLFRQATEYYRQAQQQALQKSQLESQLNLAQLRALKMQLHPHFLFNTLNGISVLVRKDPDAACSMIARLADLLRMTLDNTGAQEVPLEQELKTLACYLEIEQMRFADRLSVSLDIPDETRGALVPNLVLQPIVENAILHGVAKQRGPSTIAIRSERRNGALVLRVEDTGPGLAAEEDVREGIGIGNTRSRLERLYGKDFTFVVENSARAGAVATITIPFHTAEA